MRRSAAGLAAFLHGAVLLLALVMAAGCASPPHGNVSRPGVGRDGIGAIHLFGAPLALDLDDRGGPDGFAITIYASDGVKAQGIPLRSGSLKILMYDGIPRPQDGILPDPRRIWTFTAKELEAYAHRFAIGTGYRLNLGWEDAVPIGNRITVVAHYLPIKGGSITSSQSTITVTAR